MPTPAYRAIQFPIELDGMYKFSNLENKCFIEGGRRQKMFFEMLDFILGAEPDVHGTEMAKFGAELRGDLVIAHNLVTYKGKERRFSGDLVTASAEDFLRFVEKSRCGDDLRSMLVTPLSNEIRWVLHVSEEGVFSIYFRRQ